jgi:hypothetical protein
LRRTNFHEVQPTLANAEAAIANGVRGTTMSRWAGKLTPDDRVLLARYVRTLYSPKE